MRPRRKRQAHGVPNARPSPVDIASQQERVGVHDPRIQSGIIRPPFVELTAENTDQVVVRVKDGTMLVFPAYLQHSVDASASEEERISISFNIMFSSFTKNLSKPLW